MAPRYILDSFALLAFLEDETGAAVVGRILSQCSQRLAHSWLSIINYGEVLYITEREQGVRSAQKVIAWIDQLPTQVMDADRRLTFEAAHIKANHALSYADAFVVALAQRMDAQIVTGDPEFQRTVHLADVLWLEA